MFRTLVEKELRRYLLDARFLFVLALSVGLAALSMYVGRQHFVQQLRDYDAAEASRRKEVQQKVESDDLNALSKLGYSWNREPEVLSPLVTGLSNVLGREVTIRYVILSFYKPLQLFESSYFESNPAPALFGVLDLSFIVKVVLSLAVLLFAYDTVCGEKEDGTLRLMATYPVPAGMLALSKLVSAALLGAIPALLAFLLSAVAYLVAPEVALEGRDWVFVASITTVSVLYLVVFAAFGVWGSALARDRSTALLMLLGLWVVWLFVVPNAALRVGRALAPVTSLYELQAENIRLRADLSARMDRELDQSLVGTFDGWGDLSTNGKRSVLWSERGHPAVIAARFRWLSRYEEETGPLLSRRDNTMLSQQRWVQALSSLSPVGAYSFAAMDFAGTGLRDQLAVQNAVGTYRRDYLSFLQAKERQMWEPDLSDFTPFGGPPERSVRETLARNLLPALNLVLLAVLGFAGAFFAIVRYDVR